MVEYGFSFWEALKVLDECTYREVKTILVEIENIRKVRSVEQQLMTAEAINQAYIGSQPSKTKRTSKNYGFWRQRQINKINKIKGRTEKIVTVWDRLPKGKSRLIG